MLQIIFGKQKKANFFLFFLKSRREDYEVSPQFRTQMGDGYDFFASVRDGVSIQHVFSLTNLVLVVVLVVKSKAPYYLAANGHAFSIVLLLITIRDNLQCVTVEVDL
jgi:hypothetical protein